MRAASFLALFLTLAQGAGMEIEWIPGDAKTPGRAKLTNTSTVPLTAYMVQFEYINGDDVRPANRRTLEAVPQVAHPLEPNQSATLTAAKVFNVPDANSARVVCAIFADGRTIGDDVCIKRFIDKRRQLLREDLPAVQKVVADALKQSRPDVRGILRDMDDSVSGRLEWARAQEPFDTILTEARAHTLVQITLFPLREKKDPAQAVAALKSIAATLDKWRVDLESSLPKL